MKNKIFMAGVLAIAFAFASNVYAIGQNSNTGTGSGNQIQQQTQTINQGEIDQIRVQTTQQIQSRTGDQTGAGTGTQVQQQTQQRLQDGRGTGEQVRNQNRGDSVQFQNNQQQEEQNGTTTATQRRSRVANAVQEMLQLAERNDSVGEQIRTIAQNQNQNQEKIEASLEKAQSRSSFARFFIGANYGEINKAQKLMEQNREQIELLDKIKNQLTNEDDAQILTRQIQVMEQADLQIENSLQNTEKGFSLFGWMFRLFAK